MLWQGTKDYESTAGCRSWRILPPNVLLGEVAEVLALHLLPLQACRIASSFLHLWSLVRIAESNSFLRAAVTLFHLGLITIQHSQIFNSLEDCDDV